MVYFKVTTKYRKLTPSQPYIEVEYEIKTNFDTNNYYPFVINFMYIKVIRGLEKHYHYRFGYHFIHVFALMFKI